MKCSIISGSPDVNLDYLNNIDKNSYIIAADSGYKKCKDFVPNLIIGDFDSSPKPNIDTEIIVLPAEKDDSDTTAATKETIKRGFDEIDYFGIVGSRLDHTYSNILTMNYAFDRGASVKGFANNTEIVISDSSVIVDKKYKFFSVFSLCTDSVISIADAKYPLTKYNLNSNINMGQSNEVREDKEFAYITVHSGKVFVIFCND